MDEERRLAYVAFTRAMKRLIVTRTRNVRSYAEGRSREQPAQTSRFLFGLPEDSIEGDTPDGTPAEDSGNKRRLDDDGQERLATLVEAHRQRTAEPEGDWMLVEVESEEDIQPGVRLQIQRFGICEVLSLKGSRAYVRRASGKTAQIDLSGLQVQLVVDR